MNELMNGIVERICKRKEGDHYALVGLKNIWGEKNNSQ